MQSDININSAVFVFLSPPPILLFYYFLFWPVEPFIFHFLQHAELSSKGDRPSWPNTIRISVGLGILDGILIVGCPASSPKVKLLGKGSQAENCWENRDSVFQWWRNLLDLQNLLTSI